MTTFFKNKTVQLSATLAVLMMVGSVDAHANNFSNIAENVVTSIESLPGLLTGLAYMFGILLGVLGVLKIKDHVENPGQVALKDGAIRLAAGGGLFALPIVFEAMQTTVGDGANVTAATLNAVGFNVN